MAFDLQSNEVWIALAAISVVGVTVLMAVELVRIHFAERQTKRARERLEQENVTLRQRADELEALIADIERLNEELRKARAVKTAINLKSKKMNLSTVRFIHEIGKKEDHNFLFKFTVKRIGNWERKPPERIIFHPAVWKHVNLVHVWAQDYSAGQYLVRSIFNEAAGIEMGDAPDAAVIPDGNDDAVTGGPAEPELAVSA